MERSFEFDPEPHRATLVAILHEIDGLQAGPLDPGALHQILRRHPREGRGFYSRSQLLAGYRAFRREEGFLTDEHDFTRRVQLRPVRTHSGVSPVTVFTRPHPCPGKCVFCPDDVRMPKSYLSDEPGCQRAARNGFDPYLQTYNRLRALCAIGHPTSKVEIIVLGGTWSSYPRAYQRWFIARCFDALNDFGASVDGRPAHPGQEEPVDWADLEARQRLNECSASRNVGLVVETRPDHVTAAEVLRLRRLGCTKIQLGIQSTSDAVLAVNKRGHDTATTRRAITRLRDAGFKIHGHWMCNLLGSDPEADLRDYQRLFDDPDYRPDELKVYPCSLIETAELMDHHRSGRWRPYTHDELMGVLVGVMTATPRSCRLSRVVRDIPSTDIVEGNRLANFRELAERRIARDGGQVVDIRAREIRGDAFEMGQLQLKDTVYRTGGGREHFVEYVTPDDRLVGFLRLSLPSMPRGLDEIRDSALIRELHVYGAALGLETRPSSDAQHRGVGQRLLREAARLAGGAGCHDLAVISAVGTRPYYRRRGFADGPLYQHRAVG